jgi:hypothetical protein
MEKNIHAETVWGGNKSTDLFTICGVPYTLVPLAGVSLNPIIAMGVPLAVDTATAGKSLDSSEFHRDINNTISNSCCTKEEIFLDLIKQRLTFPTPARLSYKMATLEVSSWSGFQGNAEMESDAYVNIRVMLLMLPDFMQKGPEQKAQMVAFTSLEVATKDAMRRRADFFQKFSSPRDRYENMSSFERKHLLSEMQHEKIFQGTYQGCIVKKTELFAHSEWLSDNGIFLEKTIKSLLQKSVLELSERFRK